MSQAYQAALDEVRESILKAAQRLQAIDPKFEKVSWLLEDSLSLLDEETETEEFSSVSDLLNQELDSEYLPLRANSEA